MKYSVIFIRFGKNLVDQINESNIQCRYGSSLFFHKTQEALMCKCTLNNITSFEQLDVAIFVGASGSSIAEKIIFIKCKSPFQGSPVEYCVAKFKNCIIAGCVNFDSQFYSTTNGNLKIESTQTETLKIDKNQCIKRDDCYSGACQNILPKLLITLLNIFS